MTLDEAFPSLNPVHFFSVEGEVKRLPTRKEPNFLSKKELDAFLLPSTDEITGEEPFAQVALGWEPAGLAVTMLVEKPVERVSYPDLARCDSVELFFDTRDLKSAGFTTRFCHHFYFLPQPYESHFYGEITRFRTEDTHPLASPDDLFFSPQVAKDHYLLQIYLPAKTLVAYSPEEFPRLGFTYRINRPQGISQHFAVLSDEYPFEGQPASWATLHLKETS